jgi:Tol biopolymer transport system component
MVVGLVAAGLLLVGAAVVALLAAGGVRVRSVSPADDAASVPVTAPIQIAFSEPMDPASVQAHLRIEPETRGTATADGRQVAWQPAGAWAPDTTYTVTLEAGAAAEAGGQTLAEGETWRFRTRPAHLLYLGRSTADVEIRQLYLASLNGSAPEALTGEPYGVWDYAVQPRGEAVVYSALREDGGSDLWRLDLHTTSSGNAEGERPTAGKPRQILACPGAACLAPVWSPDGRQIAYERRDIFAGAPNLDPQAGRLWLLDVETEKSEPLFEYDVPLHSAAWAPDSRHLAYVSPLVPAVEVLDLESGDIRPFPNEWGTQPAWLPAAAGDEATVVASDLALVEEPEEALVVHLFELNPATGQATDLSAAGISSILVKDTGPAPSPGGGWIAFSRQSFEPVQSTAGRQVWLMRPTGSEAYSLVRDPAGDLFGLAWRPDGGALAYLRVDVTAGPQAQPQVGVWILNLRSRRSEHVADGVMARWLP